jgi:membrane fusion protein (multidrug efflux system)
MKHPLIWQKRVAYDIYRSFNCLNPPPVRFVPPRMSRLPFCLIALFAAAGLLSVGCGPTNQYFEPPPPEVTVAAPQQRDVTEYLELTGTAQPLVTVEIRARVRGFLKERLFEEGALVKQGDLLLVIDEEPFQVKLAEAKANLEAAQTELAEAEQSKVRELAQAKLALDQAALLQAESNERRLAALVAGRTVTKDEFERAEAAKKQAVAQVQSSKVSLEQANADFKTNILSARAAVAAAHTALRNAEIELGYCRMTAPVSGRITEAYHDVGNLVGDGQSSPLATIVQVDPIHVYMTLSERDYRRYRQGAGGASSAGGTDVELTLDARTDEPRRGQIDYQDPAIDADTGTLRLRGVFPNPDGAILPGTFAHLRLPIAIKRDSLLVPERALGIDQTGQYLLVVGPDDVVHYRSVTSGPRLGELRVVEGAVQPSDRVVVEGLLRARPNTKVVPKVEAPPAATSAAETAALAPADAPAKKTP